MKKFLIIIPTLLFITACMAYPTNTCNYEWANNYYYRGANLRVGMTTTQVLQKQGEPQRISRFGDAYTKREQWFYKEGYYLYFENGYLRAWQNIRR